MFVYYLCVIMEVINLRNVTLLQKQNIYIFKEKQDAEKGDHG